MSGVHVFFRRCHILWSMNLIYLLQTFLLDGEGFSDGRARRGDRFVLSVVRYLGNHRTYEYDSV